MTFHDDDTVTCDMCCDPVGPGVSFIVDDDGHIVCRWCSDPAFTAEQAAAALAEELKQSAAILAALTVPRVGGAR
jgi:hypothetical protein